MTAIPIQQERPVFSPNLLGKFCRFDTDYTWNEVSGAVNGVATNIANINPAESYTGIGACRIRVTGTDYFTFNNPDGSTMFNAPIAGRYIVSLALKKSQVGMLSEFIVNAYVNGVPQEFVCDMSTGSGHVDGKFNTYYFVLNLNQYDDVDFDFTTKGNVINSVITFDRFKAEIDDKNLFAPTFYTAPNDEVMEYTMRLDTSNTQNLTASTDNSFGFAGTLTTRNGFILITDTGEITPRKLYRSITVDYAFDVLVPSGTNNYIDVMLTVDGVVYRANSIPFLKNTGATQHISGSWSVPVGDGFDGFPALIKLNPTANCTISNRYLGVVEHV